MNCDKCKIDKSEEDFSFKSKISGIRQKYCKDCTKHYRKYYYNNNKLKAIEYSKESKKKNKERNQLFIREYLIGKFCIDCGESDPVVLEFDHREDKLENICQAVGNGWSIENIKKEIKKCDIRCANCHRRKTSKQFNWFKK